MVKEASARHRGRFTEFHNDLVEHKTDDGMEGNQEQSRRSESSSTEPTSAVAVATARMSGDEHSDRNTTKVETDRIRVMVTTPGSHTWSLRQILSCYMSATT